LYIEGLEYSGYYRRFYDEKESYQRGENEPLQRQERKEVLRIRKTRPTKKLRAIRKKSTNGEMFNDQGRSPPKILR